MPRPLVLLALLAAAAYLWAEHGDRLGLPTAGGAGPDRSIGAGAIVGDGARDAARHLGD